MKPFGYIIIAAISALSFQSLHSQTIHSPWTASFGTNAINNPVREQDQGINHFKTWNLHSAGFKLAVGRIISNRIAFEASTSLNQLEETKPTLETENTKLPYIAFDGMFKYHLTNGLGVIDPYLNIGGGYTWLNTIGAGTVNGGAGANIWISNSFGLNLQTTYKHAFEAYGLQHWQHSGGIVFRFGGKDSDNDGINDEKDACPELFGPFETNGCPDADKDGVIDSKDFCPNTFGATNLRGCPDNDGDGTPDKYDKCPKVKGNIKNNGCPVFDTDKDGVIDSKDKCPKQPGSTQNAGCPIKKKAQNKKQPKKTTQVNQQIEQKKALNIKVTNELKTFTQSILFNKGKASLTKKDMAALDNIVKIMRTQPIIKFQISGHTDASGSSESNMILSANRAKKVKNYLISKGINAQNLTSKGYGENFPIADNITAYGRLKNRRVEISIIN